MKTVQDVKQVGNVLKYSKVVIPQWAINKYGIATAIKMYIK